jgi:Family of unknown function (DUF6535)
MSLTCALLATLLQQWARRYLTITQPPRYSPHKRAPIRAFFADGVEKYHLPSSVEALPALLHLSLFLFLIGLVIFLFNIHHTVFSIVVWWVGLAAGGYMCITVMPIFRHDSPYFAPLSSSAWFFYTGIRYAVLNIYFPVVLSYPRADRNLRILRKRFLEGMSKTVQEIGSRLSVEINSRIVRWTFDALDEDHELEQFFASIPGFCSSEVVSFSKIVLADLGPQMKSAFHGFLNRTLSSNLLLEADKKRRLVICVKVADQLHLSAVTTMILRIVFSYGVDVILGSIDIGHTLSPTRSRGIGDEDTGLTAQGIIAGIIATVPERDTRWMELTKDQLGVSEDVLRDYLAHGDSVLLANLIHIIRPLLRLCLGSDQHESFFLLIILPCISEFDIQNTLPGLQHEFCALWNEILLEACKTGEPFYPWYILRPIRHLYIALHQGTDCAPTAFDASTDDHDNILYFASSYPLCNILGHQSHIDNAATIAPPTIQPHHTVLNTITPSTAPNVPSFSASTLDQTRTHPSEQSSLPGVPDATLIIPSFYRSSPTSVENNDSVATSLDSTQGPTDTATISPRANSDSDPLPTAGVLTSTHHALFGSPSSSTVDPHYNTDLGVVPGTPLLSSVVSVPGHTIPGNLHSSLASPASQAGQVSPGLLFPSTMPQRTPVSHANTSQNDGICDAHRRSPQISNVEAPNQSHQEATSVSDIATNVSHHPLDIAPCSDDIDCSE